MVKYSKIDCDNLDVFLKSKTNKCKQIKNIDGRYYNNFLYENENGLYIGVFENVIDNNHIFYNVFFSFSEEENKEIIKVLEDIKNDLEGV